MANKLKVLTESGLSHYHEKNTNYIDEKVQEAVSDKANSVCVTYAELYTLYDNGELVPGQQYRITDYVTTTTAAGTQSAGHQFDIIVTADSKDRLNENARAIDHGFQAGKEDDYFMYANLSGWKLKYDIVNSSYYAWSDSKNGKGVIYEMIDDFGNRAGYDFKNIQFIRYKITSAPEAVQDLVGKYGGMYYSASETFPADSITSSYGDFEVDTTDFVYKYTFDNNGYDASVRKAVARITTDYKIAVRNYIGDVLSSSKNYIRRHSLPDIVFANNDSTSVAIFNNYIYGSSRRITFGHGAIQNTIEAGSNSMIFGDTFMYNTISKYSMYNFVGDNCCFKTFNTSLIGYIDNGHNVEDPSMIDNDDIRGVYELGKSALSLSPDEYSGYSTLKDVAEAVRSSAKPENIQYVVCDDDHDELKIQAAIDSITDTNNDGYGTVYVIGSAASGSCTLTNDASSLRNAVGRSGEKAVINVPCGVKLDFFMCETVTFKNTNPIAKCNVFCMEKSNRSTYAEIINMCFEMEQSSCYDPSPLPINPCVIFAATYCHLTSCYFRNIYGRNNSTNTGSYVYNFANGCIVDDCNFSEAEFDLSDNTTVLNTNRNVIFTNCVFANWNCAANSQDAYLIKSKGSKFYDCLFSLIYGEGTIFDFCSVNGNITSHVENCCFDNMANVYINIEGRFTDNNVGAINLDSAHAANDTTTLTIKNGAHIKGNNIAVNFNNTGNECCPIQAEQNAIVENNTFSCEKGSSIGAGDKCVIYVNGAYCRNNVFYTNSFTSGVNVTPIWSTGASVITDNITYFSKLVEDFGENGDVALVKDNIIESRMTPQAAHCATVVVAASDSRNKDVADYICDGTNDEVEINAAIASLDTEVGGKVVLMEGTFNTVNPIELSCDFTTLEGAGTGTAIMHNPPVAETSSEVFAAIQVTGIHNIVKHMYIEGTGDNAATVGVGVRIQPSGTSIANQNSCVVEYLYVSSERRGIMLDPSSIASVNNSFPTSNYNVISKNVISDCNYGIILAGLGEMVNNNHIRHVDNGIALYGVSGLVSCAYNTISDNHISNLNGSGEGIVVGVDCNSNTISNNMIEDSKTTANSILIQGLNNIVTGNQYAKKAYVDESSDATTNIYANNAVVSSS